MRYEIYWDKYKIIQTEKVNKIYISILNKENFMLAINNGMPSFLLSYFKVVDYKIPHLITNRVPLNHQTNEKSLIEYIKKTNCIYNTDKFVIKVID